MATRRKKRHVLRTYEECRRGGDLLRPEVGRDLQRRLVEEQRRAEEVEDRYFEEFSAEIDEHPIGHPGHVPHGCT